MIKHLFGLALVAVLGTAVWGFGGDTKGWFRTEIGYREYWPLACLVALIAGLWVVEKLWNLVFGDPD